MPSYEARITFAASLVRQARYAVLLSGAGISTPSGIPDFRSEGSGLWARVDPLEVASLTVFRHTPERFFEWFRPLAYQMYHARPNAAHQAVADLEHAGYLRAVITQNIDNLHQQAGSQRVIQVHGTLETLTCRACFYKVKAEPYLEPFVRQGIIPRCPRCGEILKPDVILFGEQLPQKAWMEAQEEVRRCDLLIVAGSSLEVMPVASLPIQALDRGAHLIIINQSETYLGVRADVLLLEDVARALPDLAQAVLWHSHTAGP